MQNDYLGQHFVIIIHHLMINGIFKFVFDKLSCNSWHEIKFYKWDILIQYDIIEKSIFRTRNEFQYSLQLQIKLMYKNANGKK